MNTRTTISEPLAITHSTTVGQMPPLVRLREWRVKRALNQIDLAERAKVARTTIVRLEQGNPNVLPRTLRKLARALGVKPEDLMAP